MTACAVLSVVVAAAALVACDDGTPTAVRTPAAVPSAPAPVAAYLAISPAKARIDTGATLRLDVTAQDAQRRPLARAAITWSSADSTLATVDAGGVVHARTAGYVAISAVSGAASAYALLQIAVNGAYPYAIVVEPQLTTLSACGSQTLRARTDPDIDDTRFRWTSSDTTVLRVDAGVVRGVTAGSAQLSVEWLPDPSRQLVRSIIVTACGR